MKMHYLDTIMILLISFCAFFCLCCSKLALGDDGSEVSALRAKLKKCDDAVNACGLYAADLNDEINVLSDQNTKLKQDVQDAIKEAAENADRHSTLAPYACAAIGGAVGYGVGKASGGVGGVLLGAGAGAASCLLIREVLR